MHLKLVSEKVSGPKYLGITESTRSLRVKENHTKLPTSWIKLARVIACLEKNVRLMEVNLKDEAAIEDFYLSSLRIWTAI